MIQFHAANPFRQVNWRWERARYIRENVDGKIPMREDDYVKKALEFQLKLYKCTEDVERWELMDGYPEIYAAYLIYRQGDDELKHPLRYIIEARLLAGQTPEEIDGLLGFNVGTVQLYEGLFFNVLCKLNQSDYIMSCVLGPSIHAGLSDRDYDLLWKLYGYLYGPIVLDTFIQTTSKKYRPEAYADVDVALAEDARSSIQRKASIIARTFNVNPFSQTELLNLYTRMLEVERSTDSGKAQDVILQNIQVMIDKLPFKVGGKSPKKIEQSDKNNYDLGSAELRTDELLTVTAGGLLVNKDEIENISFPEQKIVHEKTN